MRSAPLPPPAASLTHGSAGLACALHRIACANDDAELLALADLWSVRAIQEIADESAFSSDDLEIAPERALSSFYHGPAGVYAAQALIAQSRSDSAAQCVAAAAFMQACRKPWAALDLTLGRAGALLGCVFLLDALDAAPPSDGVASTRDELRGLGNNIFEQLWRIIGAYAPIRESRELSLLGIAHGWAGLLYASTCWCAATGQPVPDALRERLRQMEECAEPAGRGLQWKWDLAGTGGTSRYMAGWCNGSAGHVFLWTQAYRTLGVRQYLDLAEGAAWNSWETASGNSSLCCGIAGQAYALLNFYRHSGDGIWLRRALDMAGSASSLGSRPASLYKGDAGIAVLGADLAHPEQARMPMFEREF